MTLDTPNGKRPMRLTIWISAVLILVIAAWAWWAQAWIWRLPVLIVIGIAVGEILTRLLMRDVRKTIGRK